MLFTEKDKALTINRSIGYKHQFQYDHGNKVWKRIFHRKLLLTFFVNFDPNLTKLKSLLHSKSNPRTNLNLNPDSSPNLNP